MLAAGILIFAIAALLTSFMYSTLQGRANSNTAVAVTDCQYVMEKIKDTAYADISGYTDTNFTSLTNESVSVGVTTSGTSKLITANLTWTEGGRRKNYELTTQVSW